MAIDLRSLRRDLQSEPEIGRSLTPVSRSQEQTNRLTADAGFRRTTSIPVQVTTQNIRRAALVVLGLIVIGVLSFLGYRTLRKAPAAPSRFQRLNVTKLTT